MNQSNTLRSFVVCLCLAGSLSMTACTMTPSASQQKSEQIVVEQEKETAAAAEKTDENSAEEPKFSPWGLIGAALGFALGFAIM